MAHFARIKNGIVDFVTVGRDDDENREDELAHDGWVYRRTSYNTDIDAFVPPKPFASWLLNESTAQWEAPVAMPEDAGTGEPPKRYQWDEATTSWVEVEQGA